MNNVEFIKPKTIFKVIPDWKVSENTKAIVKNYADYTGLTESEVIDSFLKNILKDPDFFKWASKQRNNKKLTGIFNANNININNISEDKPIE